MSTSNQHSKLFETVGVALDEYEYLWKLHASGIDIYERTHRLAVEALADLEEQYAAIEAENDRFRSENRDFKVTVDALSDKLGSTIEQFDALHRAFEKYADEWDAVGTTEVYGPDMAAEIRNRWKDSIPASQPAVSEGEEDAGAVESHRPGLAASDPRAAHSPSETPAQSPAKEPS